MTVSASRITVGTAVGGTLVASNAVAWEEGTPVLTVMLTHVGAAGTAFLDGGTAVSTGTGYAFVSTAGAATVNLYPGEQLWAVGTAVGGTLSVLSFSH